MKNVAIVDTRILTALGDLNDTWEGLLANQSGLKRLGAGLFPDDMPVGMVSNIDEEFGKLKRFQKLLDAVFDESFLLPDDSAIVISTTKGAVDELQNAKQAPDWQGQPWNIDDYLCNKVGSHRQVTTISAACASGTLAVIHGAMKIAKGESKFVWVVGIDVLSTFVSVGFNKLKAVTKGHCRPFDINRDGLALGEGVGSILLADEEEAEKLNYKLLAKIKGWGSSCDAVHITAPSRTANGLIESIRQAIDNKLAKVGGINAHGTGTIFNDAMEMFAFNNLWESPPPFHSAKGAIGHTLGAAGVIETALAVKSLNEGILPPTVGFQDSGNAVKGGGVRNSVIELIHPSILKCNSGFGGINAAILLGS